jgi:alpha-beta hydrolase superfamily lysophospholipase
VSCIPDAPPLPHARAPHGARQTARRLGAGFAARGHVFVALEQHGHGRSTGQRGLVVSFDLLVQHALQFVEHVVGAGRVIVAGHSLGGAVAAFLGAPLRQQLGARFLGAILIAPSLSGPTPDWVTRTALAGLSNVWGGAPVGPPEHPEEYDTGSGLDINYRGNMQVLCTSPPPEARACVKYAQCTTL